jgi:arylsulfatase A-like enzyme
MSPTPFSTVVFTKTCGSSVILPVLFALGAGLLASACSRDGSSASPGTAPPPRNVVILVVDTLRADHVGAYGYERDTTPRIDALADTGVLFDFTLAQSNWTVPATASLLTSLYPSEHGAGIDGDVRLLGETPPNQIRTDAQTLGELLQANGLRTGLFSANPYLYGRFTQGFDTAEVSRKNAQELTDSALAWLQKTADEPFFLYLQYMDLHQPVEPPALYFHYFKVAEGGERGRQHTDWSYGQQEDLSEPAFRRFRAHRIALYDGALRYVDAEIGRLVDSLEKLGVAERTLLVVTSDHGEEFWDHAAIEHELGGDPRGLWGIGHGHSMFQEVLHIPLIFHGAGVSEARRAGCAARQIDVAPTALDLLGFRPPPEMRGRSLAPFLRRAAQAERCLPVPLVAESPAYGPNAQAVIWKRRKLIVRQDGVELLYDLGRDPGEKTDLSVRHPEVAAQLRRMLEQERAAARPRGKSEGLPFDAETRKQLESLGYIKP